MAYQALARLGRIRVADAVLERIIIQKRIRCPERQAAALRIGRIHKSSAHVGFGPALPGPSGIQIIAVALDFESAAGNNRVRVTRRRGALLEPAAIRLIADFDADFVFARLVERILKVIIAVLCRGPFFAEQRLVFA